MTRTCLSRPGLAPAAILSALVALAACGDDSPGTPDPQTPDASPPLTPDAAVSTPDAAVSTPDAPPVPTAPELPAILSIGSTCTTLGIGPLCSVTQTGSTFTANCSGVRFSGTVQPTGDLTFASSTTPQQAAITCTGRFTGGQVAASCSRPADTGSTSCNLVSQRDVLPGVACLELPQSIDTFRLSPERGSLAPVTLGSCALIQDDCVFQAECAEDVVITGAVTATGVTFSRPITTLVRGPLQGAAPAPGQPDTRPPQFEAGVEFAHTCTTTLTGTAVSGTCWAGGRALITDTTNPGHATQSRWPISGTLVGVPATCAAITSVNEKLFALDSCEELRDGADGEPGIGQPVCAFRQNNCIWEVNCGNSPLLRFAGRIQPGDRRFAWKLATGTPCDAGFDASGKLDGKCTVPGAQACNLTETAAVPGVAGQCPAMPATGFLSRGCGGASVACRTTLQHGCSFMSLCAMGPFADLVIAGRASFEGQLDRLDFNGAADRQCHATKQASVSTSVPNGTTPDQFSSEWRGDCPSPSLGAGCRGAGVEGGVRGFFGLQLFFRN